MPKLFNGCSAQMRVIHNAITEMGLRISNDVKRMGKARKPLIEKIKQHTTKRGWFFTAKKGDWVYVRKPLFGYTNPMWQIGQLVQIRHLGGIMTNTDLYLIRQLNGHIAAWEMCDPYKVPSDIAQTIKRRIKIIDRDHITNKTRYGYLKRMQMTYSAGSKHKKFGYVHKKSGFIVEYE
jgi:hypothetical protein